MIIINGDSWGVGEWSVDVTITGHGITEYFLCRSSVINLSKGGSSLKEQITEFENFADRFTFVPDDEIYWIITDPLRAWRYTNDQFPLGEIVIGDDPFKDTTIDQFVRNNLIQELRQIDDIAVKKNIYKIMLIGGLCDLTSIDMSSFEKLKIEVLSWGKLLESTYNESLYNETFMLQLIPYLKTTEHVKEWNQLVDETLAKRQSQMLIADNNLSNDSGWHPNSAGHQILFNYLVNNK
jgi:hypothetical protein